MQSFDRSIAQGDGEAALKKLQTSLKQLSDIVETKDKEKVFNQNAVCLNLIGDVEQAMVKGFPFSVPKEYDNLPQLKVRPAGSGLGRLSTHLLPLSGQSCPLLFCWLRAECQAACETDFMNTVRVSYRLLSQTR